MNCAKFAGLFLLVATLQLRHLVLILKFISTAICARTRYFAGQPCRLIYYHPIKQNSVFETQSTFFWGAECVGTYFCGKAVKRRSLPVVVIGGVLSGRRLGGSEHPEIFLFPPQREDFSKALAWTMITIRGRLAIE